MKNEITTMNRNSAEQRRTNDAETVEKANGTQDAEAIDRCFEG
mgnify:CR=1 FL=1